VVWCTALLDLTWNYPSVTLVSPAKTAELIEMPYGLMTRVGPRNRVLDGGPHPPMGKGNFMGEGASRCKV